MAFGLALALAIMASAADAPVGPDVPAPPEPPPQIDLPTGPQLPPELRLSAMKAEATVRIPLIGLEGAAHDACSGIGRVQGLDLTHGEELKVYEAPNHDSKAVDTLGLARLVWLCEADTVWQGIVYAGPESDLGDCRVSSPVTRPEPYDGPCRYGWVEARYLQLIAG